MKRKPVKRARALVQRKPKKKVSTFAIGGPNDRLAIKFEPAF